MKNKALYLILTTVVISFTIACTKTGPQGPVGQPGPSYSGSISGNISFFDQYGTRILTGIPQVKVTIAELNKSVVTDIYGHYLFSNVATGNYTITATDTTNMYASDKLIGQQLIDGNINRDFKMSQLPNFALSSFTVSDSTVLGNLFIKIVCRAAAADTRARTTVIFLGTDSLVTTNNYLLSYSQNIKPNQLQYTLLVPLPDIYGAGITSGHKAFCAIYPAATSYATTSSYEDIYTGRTIYNALGAIPVTGSITVP